MLCAGVCVFGGVCEHMVDACCLEIGLCTKSSFPKPDKHHSTHKMGFKCQSKVCWLFWKRSRHICLHTYIFIYMFTYIYIYIYMYVNIYTNVYIYIYIYMKNSSPKHHLWTWDWHWKTIIWKSTYLEESSSYCMLVYRFIPVWWCIYVAYVYMYTYIWICACMYACMHVCMFAYM